MENNKEFVSIYSDIQKNIDKALSDIHEIEIKDKDGKEHIDRLIKDLGQIKDKFSNETRYLKDHSEWEKFTIAFFGETNAGKSTILEALRIIFKEKKRQEQIKNNNAVIEDLENSFSRESDSLISKINDLYIKYNKQTGLLSDQIGSLAKSYKNEYRLLEENYSTLTEEYSNVVGELDSLKGEYGILLSKYNLAYKAGFAIAVCSLMVIGYFVVQ